MLRTLQCKGMHQIALIGCHTCVAAPIQHYFRAWIGCFPHGNYYAYKNSLSVSGCAWSTHCVRTIDQSEHSQQHIRFHIKHINRLLLFRSHCPKVGILHSQHSACPDSWNAKQYYIVHGGMWNSLMRNSTTSECKIVGGNYSLMKFKSNTLLQG